MKTRFWLLAGVAMLLLTACGGGGNNTEESPPVSLSACEQSGDATAPAITVDSPLRGSMIVAAQNQNTVRVQGTITDDLSELASVQVNGEDIALPADSTEFTLDLESDSQWGLNIVDVVATDACGNQSTHSQSYLFSETYLPAAVTTDSTARVGNAQTVRLTQQAIDDGDRSDVNDLATFAERVMQAYLGTALYQAAPPGTVLVNQAAGSCLAVAPGYRASIRSPGITIGTTRVNRADLVAGGISYQQTVSTISIPLAVSGELCGVSINDNITVSALSMTGSATLQAAIQNGTLRTSIPSNPTINITGLSISSNAFPDWLINPISTQVIPILQDVLSNTVRDVIRNEVPGIADGVLNQFTALDQSLPLGGPYNQALNLSTGLESLAITNAAITQGFYTQLYPSAAATPYAGQGAITRDVAAVNLSTSPGPLTLAVNDNFINQGLWALWYGGGLEQADLLAYVTAAIGNRIDLSGLQVGISALQPPVLMPGSDDDEFAFGIGDLKVMLAIDRGQNPRLSGSGIIDVELYASTLIDDLLHYDFATNTLALNGDGVINDFHVHIASIRQGGSNVTDPAIIDDISNYVTELVAGLMNQIGLDSLQTIPLPAPQLTIPVPVAIGIDSVDIDIVSLLRQAGNFIVDADIDAAWNGVFIDPNLWPVLANAAAEAARSDVLTWLEDARIRPSRCFVNGEVATGKRGALGSTHLMTTAIKDALLDAGATYPIARNWNRAFKRAWSRWANQFRIPDLPWYPSFASYPEAYARLTGMLPEPMSNLGSEGLGGMQATALADAIRDQLGSDADTDEASAAIDSFAQQVADRFSQFIDNGRIQNIYGEGPVPSMLNPFNPQPGPVVGVCYGNNINFDPIFSTTAF